MTDHNQDPKPKSAIPSQDPLGQSFVELIDNGICTNCTVLTARAKVILEDGTEAGPAQGM
jgi:hypothetical protein